MSTDETAPGPLMANLPGAPDIEVEYETSGQAVRLSWWGVDLGRFVVDASAHLDRPALVRVAT